jgi:hypothetical protein
VDIVPVNSQSVIATNASGQVMVVWEAKQGRDYVVQSAFNGSGSWRTATVPLPPGEEKWLSTELHGLASHGTTFSLLLDRRGEYYIYPWNGSAWGTPVPAPSDYESSTFTLDATGNPVFAYRHNSSVIKKFVRYVGGQWQAFDFPVRLEDPWKTIEQLFLGRTGAIHLLARGKNYVPTVATTARSSTSRGVTSGSRWTGLGRWCGVRGRMTTSSTLPTLPSAAQLRPRGRLGRLTLARTGKLSSIASPPVGQGPMGSCTWPRSVEADAAWLSAGCLPRDWAKSLM